MKSLTLFRHAKTERESSTGRDFDRRLAARGHRDAPRMGKEIRKLGLDYDLVLSSPAARAAETAELAGLSPRYDDAGMPRDHAERVVMGACNLSPFLGERMVHARLFDTPVFVRELLPKDLKLEIERVDTQEALRVARYLARIVGRAHARQLACAERKAWQAELRRHRPSRPRTPTRPPTRRPDRWPSRTDCQSARPRKDRCSCS